MTLTTHWWRRETRLRRAWDLWDYFFHDHLELHIGAQCMCIAFDRRIVFMYLVMWLSGGLLSGEVIVNENPHCILLPIIVFIECASASSPLNTMSPVTAVSTFPTMIILTLTRLFLSSLTKSLVHFHFHNPRLNQLALRSHLTSSHHRSASSASSAIYPHCF